MSGKDDLGQVEGPLSLVQLRLLAENALRVFSEPDETKRLVALAELWTVDSALLEEQSIVIGHRAISDSVGALLRRLPPGTVFEPRGTAAGHHGLARLRWNARSADGTDGPVSGIDIAHFSGDRIDRLYVVLDPVA